MPRVSLIMTVRNGEPYLTNALAGLLAQSFTDTEIIVVNNGSTDATANILAAINDPRLKIISVDSNINSSFASGISKAFHAATGEFIAVQDCDDLSHKSRIEKQVRFLDDNPEVGLVGTGAEWINENDEHLYFSSPSPESAELMQHYIWTNPLAHSSVMFRRSLANQFGGYNTKFGHACDYRMALDIMFTGNQVSALEEPLVKMRQHNKQESALPHTAMVRSIDFLALLECAQKLPFLTKASRSKGRHQITKTKFQIVLILLRDGKILDALKFLGKAALEAPFYLMMYAIVRTFRGQLGDAPRPPSQPQPNGSE